MTDEPDYTKCKHCGQTLDPEDLGLACDHCKRTRQPDLTKRIAELEAENERLREIVERLHKDAQGNPVVPGSVMWSPKVRRADGSLAELIYRSGDRPVLRRAKDINAGLRTHGCVRYCYLSRAAAEAARKEANG